MADDQAVTCSDCGRMVFQVQGRTVKHYELTEDGEAVLTSTIIPEGEPRADAPTILVLSRCPCGEHQRELRDILTGGVSNPMPPKP
jgi:hypothetical protein